MNKRSVKREASDLVGTYFKKCNSGNTENEEEFLNILPTDSNSSFSSLSDCTDSEEDTNIQFTIKEELAQWAVNENISNSAINALLKILRQHFVSLPVDARTLKSTPRNPVSKQIEGGQYTHYGVEKVLEDYCNALSRSLPTTITLHFNIDGLPLSKSSGRQVWPILLSMDDSTVYNVGVFEGLQKPVNCNEYLQPLVDDLFKLDGKYIYADHEINLKIGAFVCDAPARAFILNIKGHTGYSSCNKCTQKGEWMQHKMVFKYTDYVSKRTDQHFREKQYPDHHKNLDQIILERLPINMVTSMVLDYMHVVCLGVMRMLLRCWKNNRKQSYSISPKNLKLLDAKIISVKNQTPREFQRKPRSLQELDNWKATEYRTFLLYTGPVVLKTILDSNRYDHFLLLSIAMRILMNHDSANYGLAHNLLNEFVAQMEHLYSQLHLGFNVHCLLHLVDDVKEFGSIDVINAFKYENYLQQIKKMVKKRNQSAVQIYNRLVEKSTHAIVKKDTNEIICKNTKNSCFIKSNSLFLSVNAPDNFYYYENRIFKMTSYQKSSNGYEIKGQEVLALENFFDTPIKSTFVNIYSTKSLCYSDILYSHNFYNIKKCFNMAMEDEIIFTKLNH